MSAKILEGNVLETLKDLPACSVQCVVTSPPYYGLRSYYPDAVCLRSDLSLEQQNEIIKQLSELGIYPIDHTTE